MIVGHKQEQKPDPKQTSKGGIDAVSAKTTVNGVVIMENQVLNPFLEMLAGKIFKSKNLTSFFVCDLLKLRKPNGGPVAGANSGPKRGAFEINYGKELGL